MEKHPNGRGVLWTPAMDELLRSLHGSGFSMREIGERLDGLSRNAVIGRANRLGLSRPTRSSTARLVNKEKRAKAAELPPDPKGRPQGFQAATVALERRHCRFPHGDPQERAFHYCMASAEPGRPYCEEHRIKATSCVGEGLSKADWRQMQMGRIRTQRAA